MSSAILLAWASPASPESTEQFHQWYESTHVPQVRESIPSIRQVSRYELVDPESGPQGRFLAVYEMDETDVAAAAAALGAGVEAGSVEMSPAMDVTSAPPVTQWYVRHTS